MRGLSGPIVLENAALRGLLYLPIMRVNVYYSTAIIVGRLVSGLKLLSYVAGLVFMRNVGKRLHRPSLGILLIVAFTTLLLASGCSLFLFAWISDWLPEQVERWAGYYSQQIDPRVGIQLYVILGCPKILY